MTTTFPIGVAIFPPTAQKVLRSVKRAEQAGVPMAWIPSHPVGPDGLGIVTAAAVQTSTIGAGHGYCYHVSSPSTYTGKRGAGHSGTRAGSLSAGSWCKP